MDLLKDDLGKLYRKFLIASFGSALIASIYGLVDMIVVGQYHGPDGAAAMSVIAPVWNIIYSFGLLTGIGALRSFKGQGKQKSESVFYLGGRVQRDNIRGALGDYPRVRG